jgi:hypothetical protein
MVFDATFKEYFNYIVAVSFIGGGNPSTKKKHPNVVGSNPAHVEIYFIQQYVIKFVSDMRQVGVFSWYSGFLHQ